MNVTQPPSKEDDTFPLRMHASGLVVRQLRTDYNDRLESLRRRFKKPEQQHLVWKDHELTKLKARLTWARKMARVANHRLTTTQHEND